jgi:hydrogenase expression/formation protein HypE
MEDFPIIGKIQNNFFKSRVFPYCGKLRSEVIVGPQFGVDVSIVNLHHGLVMAMTSDPLSLIPTLGLQESAWLSVQLMANDMATTGFAPQYAQFVLNLPNTLSAGDFENYWKYIHEYCEQLGVAITGGHTGRFDGLNSTVSGGGTMITIAPGEDIITSKGARPGDVVIMTKESALISTAILAMSFPETVKNACGKDIHQQACELFYNTSAVEAGLAAGEIGRLTKGVTAMHDVTEGGVMGALYELAHASACGLDIDATKILQGEAQKKVGELFHVDPLYCVGAGSMIITAKPDKYALLLTQLKAKNISATVIGKTVEAVHGLTIRDGNEEKSFDQPNADPYWNAFFNAFNNGWK